MCFAVENIPMELYICSLFYPQHNCCQDQYWFSIVQHS